jgi:HEPN domain-containing protein
MKRASNFLIDRDQHLKAARAELKEDPPTEPSLRELLESITDARWQHDLLQAELSLSGRDSKSLSATSE